MLYRALVHDVLRPVELPWFGRGLAWGDWVFSYSESRLLQVGEVEVWRRISWGLVLERAFGNVRTRHNVRTVGVEQFNFDSVW